MPKMPNNR